MIEVWTLLVNDGNGRSPQVTVHPTELDAIQSLRDNYDQTEEFETAIPDDPSEYDTWVESFTMFFLIDAGIDKHLVAGAAVVFR